MSPDLLLNAIRRELLQATLRNHVPTAVADRRDADARTAIDPDLLGRRFVPASRILEHVDVVVSCNEVNERHGTGILIKRMFSDPNRVVSIRANDHYGGEQRWGRHQLVAPEGAHDRTALSRWVLMITEAYTVDRIFCVPYGEPELQIALALRDATDAPLCLYIMDDHNVRESRISDRVMGEAVEKATVRLAISSDMRDSYELKYGHRFWIAPPTILHRQDRASTPVKGTAVVIGNIWGRSWLDAFRATVRTSGLRVTWYCNNPTAPWLGESMDGLARDGIEVIPALPEQDLAAVLGTFELALLPTAPSLEGTENAGVAGLSLPSRVPFILGACDVPVIVLGDPTTCSSRFVRFFGVGGSCAYDAESFATVMAEISSSSWRADHTVRLERIRAALDCADLPGWFRDVTDHGRPTNLQFESLEVQPRLVVPQYIDESPSLGPWLRHMNPLRACLSRMRDAGFEPSFIIDVGASNGIWSSIVSGVYPTAHYVQVEPLRTRYDPKAIAWYLAQLAHVDVVEAAVADEAGTATLHVDEHLYGASLILDGASDKGPLEEIVVPVRTLDDIASEFGLQGEGLVKLDIQGAEIRALHGGSNVIRDHVGALILEITIDPESERVPSLLNTMALLDSIGFTYYDDAGEWRDPANGVLLQKDVVFVKKDHPLALARRMRG